MDQESCPWKSKAASHTRLRAHDHCTSSTLIGGKGRAGPSSLHTTLEGPTKYVNGKMEVKSTWIPTWHQMDRVPWSLDYFQKSLLGGRPNTKPRDHGTSNAHNHWFILFHHAWGPKWIESHWNSIWLMVRSHMTSHYTWGSVTTVHDFGGVLGWPLDFLLGSHNFMVTALGSCVKLALSALVNYPMFVLMESRNPIW
jgi:hypothetical protein